MSTNFTDFLYKNLPGLYRDKDESGELKKFLQLFGTSFEELEQSITQLNDDLFVERSRKEFIHLIGKLIGVEVDATLPARIQRDEVRAAFALYRSKGRKQPIQSYAEQQTEVPVTVVDFSQRVSQFQFIEGLNPVFAHRDQPVVEETGGSGNFYFFQDRAIVPLYDAENGRPITRQALEQNPALYLGTENGFSIKENALELFTAEDADFTAIAADLSDFSDPKTLANISLAIATNQVAVDTELGRFKIVDPIPLAGNLTVNYHSLEPGNVSEQTFDLGHAGKLEKFGRVDDLLPYTLDFRESRYLTDKIGRQHIDNFGFFFNMGRRVANQKPNALPIESQSGNFTFNNRPIAFGDNQGIAMQLLDGLDGSPITRKKMQEQELLFAGTERGFTIRANGIDILDSDFQPQVTIRTAEVSDFSDPKEPDGTPMVLSDTDVAVDPQFGRFMLDLPALGILAEEIRVDYLLGPATKTTNTKPFQLSAIHPDIYAFAEDGEVASLRDGFDGTRISTKVSFGATAPDFHGQERGWRILVDGIDVSVNLDAQFLLLENLDTPVPPDKIAIDPDRGRFKFPSGFLAANAEILVSFSYEDLSYEENVLINLKQKLPKVLPAGIVPVLIDSRQTHIDPNYLI